MSTHWQYRQGSEEWFEMVGTLVSDAVSRAGTSSDLTWSLVERYIDGVSFADGLVQGIRFDIRDGRVSYRVGVRPDERGDATIEVTAAAARELNLLRSADPAFASIREHVLRTGEMRVDGDLTPIAPALNETHDLLVDQTSR